MDVSPNQLVSVAASLDPVPRARRREPRAHGLEHAAPGGAAHPHPRAARSAPAWRASSRATPASPWSPGATASSSRSTRPASWCAPTARERRSAVGQARHLQPGEVPALEPEHLHQPEADRRSRATRFKPGDVIADGPATETGELALGQNVVVAFMPWQGYNFEDSILVSERLAKRRRLHLDPHRGVRVRRPRHQARQGRDHARHPERRRGGPQGPRRVRHRAHRRRGQAGRHPGRQDHAEGRDPAVPGREAAPRDLRREGRRRARQLAAGAARACSGIVIDARVFARKGTEKDERAKDIEDAEKEQLLADQRDEIKHHLRDATTTACAKLLLGKITAARLVDDKGKVLRQGRRRSTTPTLAEVPRALLGRDPAARAKARPSAARAAGRQLEQGARRDRDASTATRSRKLTKGDELPPGVIKMVKVYLAIKSKLSVGDKMAGRHGNKGVVSRMLPEEDMPYLPDGTPGRHRAQPARRAVPDERRPDPRDPPRVGGLELGKQIESTLQKEWKGDVVLRVRAGLARHLVVGGKHLGAEFGLSRRGRQQNRSGRCDCDSGGIERYTWEESHPVSLTPQRQQAGPPIEGPKHDKGGGPRGGLVRLR